MNRSVRTWLSTSLLLGTLVAVTPALLSEVVSGVERTERDLGDGGDGPTDGPGHPRDPHWCCG